MSSLSVNNNRFKSQVEAADDFQEWKALADQRLANNKVGDNFNPWLALQQFAQSIPLGVSERAAQGTNTTLGDQREAAFEAAQKSVERGDKELPKVWRDLSIYYQKPR